MLRPPVAPGTPPLNPSEAKIASWTFATLMGAALVGSALWRVKTSSEALRIVSAEEMERKLNATPEIVKGGTDTKVAYEDVKGAMINLKWTAPRPPKVPDRAQQAAPPKPVAMTVDKLVKVIGYSVDADDLAASKAILKYLPEARVPPPPTQPGNGMPPREGILKRVGQRLDAPIGHIRVVSIGPAGVEFGFDDENRATETLLPADYDLSERLTYVDADALVSRPDAIAIPEQRNYRAPTQTVQIGKNDYRLGAEDVALIGENYASILSEEVLTRRHRNPNTGRYDGIELTQVAEGSVASRHGARAGDVIKSINGHPVTSKQEALSFVKNNQDMYDKWQVVVSNLGQERTVTFYPPKK